MYYQDWLTNEKVKNAGYDKKTEITLEDFNRDFPIITVIGEDAFRDNQILTKIQIPKKITDIWYNGFENSSLNSIEFEKGSKLKTIQDNAFKNTKIKSINIPDSVHTVQNNAFQNTAIENFYFPSNIFWIGNNVFEDCALLKKVGYRGWPMFIGANVFKNASITDYSYRNIFSSSTFAGNTTLQRVDFSLASSIWAYFFSNLLSEIDIIIPNNITDILAYAFSDSKIKSVTFKNYTDNNQLNIANYVFANCNNLIKLELPNIKTISLEDKAFAATNFTDITMPLYLKQASDSPLYGFVSYQWNNIKWI